MTKLAYTRSEAAEATGLSEDTIRRAINAGLLKAKRSGRKTSGVEKGEGTGKYLIRTHDLEAWLDTLADA